MEINQLIKQCEQASARQFAQVDQIAYENQVKVLEAFRDHKIALRHFAPTGGYGYDDIGRDTLAEVFAKIVGAEKAIVSPMIASGTHALSLMLFGILRPGDTLLSVTGDVYDTLQDVIEGEDIGSLKDYGIQFDKVSLLGSTPDYDAITAAIRKCNPKVVFIQRSRGYTDRDALSIETIAHLCAHVKRIDPQAILAVDNCYGEFVATKEPTQVGADVMAGSMIKNPGGGLAPTGGYIAGRAALIQAVGYRLTAPGVGTEVGSYAADYRPFYQGLFMAPHTTAQAVKGSILFGAVFEALGYSTLPAADAPCNDIIRSIKFNTADELIAFVRAIQSVSPVDSHVTPYPWDMPGYKEQVIMAAGTFVQGASIELSADAPIKAPYIAYFQGGLTYEHVKYAVTVCAKQLLEAKNK